MTGIVYGLMNNGNIQILNGFEGIQTTQILVLLFSVLIAHGFLLRLLCLPRLQVFNNDAEVMQIKVVREDDKPATMKDFCVTLLRRLRFM